ncbi:hypothetical protein GLX30_07130 [Streptomyces sp. Tu 2975]|uniref:DUF5947 family protein n=1 Tax=Streptomyces sp. Tu 2975 TaxID=2676871 RepID=UPI00135B5C8D|nr:DUF5947 family protein [Streptomyces sp. Tu 2975]QIP83870.1 hypothetical protein GLX30_07130 [Streptomyces sp. Tu 2975]
MSAHRVGPGVPSHPPGRRGLHRFTTARRPREEQCELCGTALAGERHRHLVDTEKRALACACGPCSQLLDRSGGPNGRFRAVPGRYLSDPGHRLDDSAWELLRIPVGVAFFLRNSALDRFVALYPSPAGATESELEPSSWQTVLEGTHLGALLEPDVEALLLRRESGRTECYLVPVDICYELVGRMRLRWQGFDGGAEARADLDAFFGHVRDTARDVQRSRS